MPNLFDQFDTKPDSETENVFDGFDKETETQSAISVPEWGQRHPNLYGAAGATYEAGKPLLEATGLVGGAMVGAGTLNPIGGAGAGYAMSKQVEQLAGEFLGVREHLPQSERFKQLRNDVIAGEIIEMGSGIVNKFIFEPIIKGGKWAFDVAKSSLTGKPGPAAWKGASKVWEANTSSGPIYAKNKQEAEILEKQIPGLKFTEGQRTYDPRRIKFERVAFKKQGDAGVFSVEQQAANDIALKSYYQKEFGGQEGVDDFISALNNRYSQMQKNVETFKQAGATIEGSLEGGNVQNIHRKLIEKVKYHKKLAHDEAEDIYKLLPEDIKIDTEDLIKNYIAIGKKTSAVENPANIPGVLERIKEKHIRKPPQELAALMKEFTDNGRPIPKQLQDIASQYGSKTQLPFKEVKGIRTEILNEMRTESSKQTGQNMAKIKRLQAMLTETETALDQLANKEVYGKNVSELYNSASAKWRYYKETFESGPVGQILQKGPKGETFKLTPEQSLAKVFNRKDMGAADMLNRAIGKDKASVIAREYADYDLITQTKNAMTGEVDSKKLARWIQSNSKILNKFGLKDTYKNLTFVKDAISVAEKNLSVYEKSQAMKMLGVDPEKAVATAFAGNGGKSSANTAKEMMRIAEGNSAAQAGIKRAFTDNIINEIKVTAKEITGTPTTSVAKFNKVYEKYEPALKEFYKSEPKKIRSLQNMKKAYEIMIRNKTSPIGGGSDTFENIVTSLHQAIGHAPIGGPMKYRALRSIGRIVTSFKQSQIESILTRAIFDPEVAYTLELISSGIKPDIAYKRFSSHIVQLIALSGKQAKEAMEEQNGKQQKR